MDFLFVRLFFRGYSFSLLFFFRPGAHVVRHVSRVHWIIHDDNLNAKFRVRFNIVPKILARSDLLHVIVRIYCWLLFLSFMPVAMESRVFYLRCIRIITNKNWILVKSYWCKRTRSQCQCIPLSSALNQIDSLHIRALTATIRLNVQRAAQILVPKPNIVRHNVLSRIMYG